MSPTKIAIMGVGKIARDQHIPAIDDNPDFELAATVSRSGGTDRVENYESLGDLLDARNDITVIAMTMPPMPRFDAARQAIAAGRHVLLEKPPGATASEVQQLDQLARAQGVTLFASWHSRHADAVDAARTWLSGKTLTGGHITWKENVREWHPGQDWIWEPGGLGIFDTGINALSILTEIAPQPLRLRRSILFFPENRDAPIAADLDFAGQDDVSVTASFDWRFEETAKWEMELRTDAGTLFLGNGGATMQIDGEECSVDGAGEYPGVYRRFADTLKNAAIDLDDRPLLHVADAFLLGKRIQVAPFHDN